MLRVRRLAMPAPGGRGQPQQSGQSSVALAWPPRHGVTLGSHGSAPGTGLWS